MPGVTRMDESNANANRCGPAGKSLHHGRGQSSYRMHDPAIIFRELDLKPGDVFLDLGCGVGDYSMHAAREVGNRGRVCAIDRQKERLDTLLTQAQDANLGNLNVVAGDICDPLPIGDNTIDICFISTVLHCIDFEKEGARLFSEIQRVLKPSGRLVIIECKKEEMPFGPPLHMRISPEELEGHLTAHGFRKTGLVDLGYNYMMTFTVKEVAL